MASSWIEKRSTGDGTRYRVRYRLGGAESIPKLGGTFRTLSARHAPGATGCSVNSRRCGCRCDGAREPETAPTLREMAARWQESRKDVREATTLQHRTSLNHVNRLLGDRPHDAISREDVQRMIDVLTGERRARESIRKCRTALAMVLDYAGVSPNPARDSAREAAPSGARRGRAAARRPRRGGRMARSRPLPARAARARRDGRPRRGARRRRRSVTWTRAQGVARAREGVEDAAGALGRATRRPLRRRSWSGSRRVRIATPTHRSSRSGRRTALRMAIGRACRDAGVPVFSPHDLRHRRISLLHHQGVTWAEIGASVGQRNLSTTADTLHARAHGLPRDRPREAARTCTRDAHPDAHLGRREGRNCSDVLGQVRPSETASPSRFGSARANSHDGEMLLPVSAMSSDGQ